MKSIVKTRTKGKSAVATSEENDNRRAPKESAEEGKGKLDF